MSLQTNSEVEEHWLPKTDLVRPQVGRIYWRHTWPSVPAPASVSTRSRPRLAKAAWVRCIAPPTRR